MQSHEQNGDDSFDDPFEEDEESFASEEDSGNAPTQDLSPYEGALPPLPPRKSHYSQPAAYEPVPLSKQAPYEPGLEDERRAPRTSFTFGIAKFNQFLSWLLWVIEVMFALRLVLKILGASGGPFIQLLYGATDPLLAPFFAGLGRPASGIEWNTVLAMIVYFLVILALVRFLRLFITDPEV